MTKYTIYGDDQVDLFDARTEADAKRWVEGYTRRNFGGYSIFTIRDENLECISEYDVEDGWTQFWY
jgi:hypothetical protein